MQSAQTHDRIYRIEAFDADGNIKWIDEFHNLTTILGADKLNDVQWRSSSFTSAPTVGLTGSAPTFANSDTLAAHPGWTEITAYAGSRPALVMAASSNRVATNAANKASFVFNANVTIGGAFVVLDGVLIGGGALNGGDRAISNGETLLITITNTINNEPDGDPEEN
jgi:hypothetical protein